MEIPLPENTRTHLLVRGDVHSEGAEITQGYPKCVAASSTNANSDSNLTRLDLANWLVSRSNPLTSRVIVNRVWHHLFGRGIVSTPNDFGKNGALPSHPELLDWLAVNFTAPRTSDNGTECGNSLKSLVYIIVTSNTYQQSSAVRSNCTKSDPDNLMLHRMNRKRLDSEELRDSILTAVGTINLKLGGPSVRVPLEKEVYDTIFTEYEPDNLWEVTQDSSEFTRRSLYLMRKRNVRLPLMALFDQPDTMTSCAARGQSVHSLQALTLINSDFMRIQSNLLAERLYKDVPKDEMKRITRLFKLAFARPPTNSELQATSKFLTNQSRLTFNSGPSNHKAWADLCLAAMNMNEFLYVR